jgi:hypothetical protein
VVNGPTYKYTVGRDDLTVTAMGAEMTAAIGLNSWAGFAGSGPNAHVAGDIAMLEGEVNAVIKTLRGHNLEVVALHHHMLGDSPRMVFLHYYGRGPATQLATASGRPSTNWARPRPAGTAGTDRELRCHSNNEQRITNNALSSRFCV